MGQKAEKSRVLFDLASQQQGLFTAKQAEQAGYSNKNHGYHVDQDHWIREGRGLYRLAMFPRNPDEQKVLYALWSQNKEGEIQGVYSHETALAHYELSDVNPAKLHMTVPKSFRRNSKIPKILKLHVSELTPAMIHKSRGFMVTKPGRTISDVIQCGWVSFDIIRQAVLDALEKGLMQKWEIISIMNHVQVSDDMKKQLHRLQKEIE